MRQPYQEFADLFNRVTATGLEEGAGVKVSDQTARIRLQLGRTYGSTEEMRQFARGIREIVQVQQQPVAILFDPNLVPGDGALAKAMHPVNLEGNLQGVIHGSRSHSLWTQNYTKVSAIWITRRSW